MLTIKKTQLVKEHIGKTLKQYGFKYIGCDLFTLWVFRKKVNNITQEICIQQKNLIEQEIKLCFYTGVYGWGNQEPRHFIEEYEGKEFWRYETQEEYIEVLKLFSEIIVNHGLEMLNKMMEPTTKICPSPELNRQLYDEYEELLRKYEGQYHILENGNPDNQVNAISQILKEHKDDDFEYCKELLLGLSAIYAEIIRREMGGSNYFDGEYILIKEVGPRKRKTAPFLTVFNGWKLYRDRGCEARDAVMLAYRDMKK